MRRTLVIIGMALLLGGWSCAPQGGGIQLGHDDGDYKIPPCEHTCGNSGHDPDPICLRDVYPPLCPVGENPS